MPFIDCKLSKKLNDSQKQTLKAELGKNISLMHKPESYLMVGINDGYDLFFAGKKLENGAYIGVKLFGTPSQSDCEKMTEAICRILESQFGIDGASVYVTYQGISDWGFDGSNF